jgi:hypothetical protein
MAFIFKFYNKKTKENVWIKKITGEYSASQHLGFNFYEFLKKTSSTPPPPNPGGKHLS